MQVQKASFFISPVIMLTCIPIINKLMDKPTTLNGGQIILFIGFLPLYVIFVRWVYRCYDKTTLKMEDMLKELGE
jgi:hypothetical protein